MRCRSATGTASSGSCCSSARWRRRSLCSRSIKLYLNQWLQIRWRRWMTRQYLDRWLADANHYRMQLLGDAADNPDQRISEDINLFIDRTLTLTVGLLSAIVTLFSFIVILWTLSAAAPLLLFGTSFVIPGYLVWAALALCDGRNRADASHRLAAGRRSTSGSSDSRRTSASTSFGCGRIPSRSPSCAARATSASNCSTVSDGWSATSCRSCCAPRSSPFSRRAIRR